MTMHLFLAILILVTGGTWHYAQAIMEDCRCWSSLAQRTPCRVGRWSRQNNCEKSGCCYDDVTSSFAIGFSGRCFEKSGVCPHTDCQVSPLEREMCGYLYTGPAICRYMGCCYDESRQFPRCYKKRSDLLVRTTEQISEFKATTITYEEKPANKTGDYVSGNMKGDTMGRDKNKISSISEQVSLSTQLPPPESPMPTNTPTSTDGTMYPFKTTSHPFVTKTVATSKYFGPNGIYELAGFSILARCPVTPDKVTDCMETKATRSNCYKHFCCWKDPEFCHMPLVRILKWPRVTTTKKKGESSWSEWSKWSPCPSPSCRTNIQRRYRECLRNPITNADCQGPDTEARECVRSCNAYWSEWSSWSSCSESCGPGTKQRARLCRRNGMLVAPSECFGGHEKAGVTANCNTNFCSEWSSWANIPCPVSCGNAIGTIERMCRQKDKEIGPPPCAVMLRVCGENPCILRDHQQLKSAFQTWGNWGKWSECSNQCGKGIRRRKRSCPPIHSFYAAKTDPAISCTGGSSSAKQQELCNEDLCSSWSTWRTSKPCSKSCGGGIKEVSRSCLHNGINTEPRICSRTLIRCSLTRCPKR